MAGTTDDVKAEDPKAEKQAQAEMKARSGREAMADYRARETAADDNANRLKGLRLARDAEAAAQEARTPAPAPKRAKKATAPGKGRHPDHLTPEKDG